MEYGNGEVNRLVWRETENRYHHEEDGLTLDNPNVNISVLGQHIKEKSIVLDVGCGEGKLGKLLKEKECQIYGIEIDKVAICYAKEKGHYVDIYNFNVENADHGIDGFERFDKAGICFDYIVISDVLEHTVNPTKVIEVVAKYLRYDGEVLVSIPNINNADIALNLLRGRFNYMESGILDNTHTKYFTKSSFVEWIADANSIFNEFQYDCQYLGGIYGLTDYMQKVKEEMPLVFAFIQLNPEYSTIQNLFSLKKKRLEDKLTYIEDLLEEKRVDLVQILSDYLEDGMDDKFVKEISGIKMLPNERFILENRANEAEAGWKKADEKYQEILEIMKKLEEKRLEAKTGWEEADRRYEEILNAMKEVDKKCLEAEQGWKRANERYQEILEVVKKVEEKRLEAEVGWKEADKKYNDIQKALIEANKRNQYLEQKYQETLQGWKEADAKANEFLEGWKECDVQLQQMKNGKI